MRSQKLRVILPAVQVAIAALLLSANYLRHDSLANPSWTKPDWQFCHAINAPASLLRWGFLAIVEHSCIPLSIEVWVEFAIETLVFLLFVAVLWYLVAVEIGSPQKGWLSVLSARSGARGAADLLLILLGVGLAALAFGVRRQFGGAITPYANLVAAPHFVWGAVLVFFYGHDLWQYTRK